jgi:hypothetical protein
MCHCALGDPRGRREWSALHRRCQGPGPLLQKQPGCGGRYLRCVSLWGGETVGRRGRGLGGRLVKALLKVPRKLLQPTQIDQRVSVVLPDDGERLTFCGVDSGVRCWRSGHRLAVRVGCDAAQDTNTPVEVLGDLGTDVRRIGRLACGLWVDALKPGLVGAGGTASVVSVVMRLVVLWSPTRDPQITVGVLRWRRGRIRECAFA